MSESTESIREFVERVGGLCEMATRNRNDLIDVESHVDTIETALSIITELSARLEKCEEFRVKAVEAMEGVVSLAKETHADWDADRDHRVGKNIAALAGYMEKYRPETTALHAALSLGSEIGGER